jgi:putative membrane protein
MRGGIKTLERKDPYHKLIVALSIIIPVAVAVLFGIPKVDGYNTKFLPPIYATINGLTAVLLVISVQAIRRGKRSLHELLMKLCIGLSALFLVMYIVYHITNEPTSYGGEGVLRYVYFFILISHILLSICVIPFVLFTFARALTGKFQRHKELAKYTYPLWLYVAVTGVIVYFMISPYYAN